MASSEDNAKDFEEATEYVKLNSRSFDSETLLKLYARYKQVKEGQCNTPKPGFFDFQGKSKWEAWKKLGDMRTECAKREYVHIVSHQDQDWRAKLSPSPDKSTSGSKPVSFGVAVSTMVNTDADLDDDMKTIFDWCKEGNAKQVSKILAQNNVNVDEKDSEGMALLHWACDRGDGPMVDMLLQHGANVNIQDGDGQSGLHFAVACDYPEVVKVLLKHGASTAVPDLDGQTVQDLVVDSTAEIKEIISSFPKR